MNPSVKELAKPFPSDYIKDDGRGNSYVPHHIVTQRLIHIFGVPPKIELLREIYDADKLTGVVMRLTVPGFEPVEEAGEADNPQSKTNGARLKDACSDAIKRAAMRLGLGLHLWAQQNYYLYDALPSGEETSEAREQAATTTPAESSRGPQEEGPEPSGAPVEARPPSSPSSEPYVKALETAVLDKLIVRGVELTPSKIAAKMNKLAGEHELKPIAFPDSGLVADQWRAIEAADVKLLALACDDLGLKVELPSGQASLV